MKPKYILTFFVTGILLLLSIIAFSQSTEKIRDQYLKVTGKPTFVAPTVSHAVDFVNKRVWRSTSTTSAQWTEEFSQSIRDFYFATGTVGPAGPKGDKGDTGAPGRDGVCPPCPPSGGGGGRIFITPNLLNDFGTITVGGTGTSQTVSQAGVNPAVYAGITVTGTDLYDWANVQYAIYLNKQTWKPVQLVYRFRTHKQWDFYKDQYNLVWEGNKCEIETVNNNTYSVFFRPPPIHHEDASAMIQAEWVMRNMYLKIGSNQTGFQLQQMADAEMSGITVAGGAYGFKFEFVLNCRYTLLTAVDCNVGFEISEGKYTTKADGSPVGVEGRASTTTIFDQCHVYTNKPCDAGFRVLKSEFITFYNPIVEGGLCKRGIEIQGGGSNNFITMMIYNYYFEAGLETTKPPSNYTNPPYTIGQGQAALYVRQHHGLVSLIYTKNVYRAPMVDAGSQGGDLLINIEGVSYWDRVNKKMFYTEATATGCVRWIFTIREHNSMLEWNPATPGIPYPVTNYFEGRPITEFIKTAANQEQPCWTVQVR